MTPEESTAAVRLAAGVLIARIKGDVNSGLDVMGDDLDPAHLAFGMTILADIAVNLAARALGQPADAIAEQLALQAGQITEEDV